MSNTRQRPTSAACCPSTGSSESNPEEPRATSPAESPARTAPHLIKRAPRRGDDIDYLELLLLEFKL